MENILITGITGQDGAYLARDLLAKGFNVYGSIRRASTPSTARLNFLEIESDVKLIPLELTELANVIHVLNKIKPKYIYNLAAQSFVADSFIHPHITSQINYVGVLNLLEAIKITGIECNIYQASTSEMYGDVLSNPQNEETRFNPMSPYAVSKCAAHHLMVNYREAYGMKASSGILFNHESELRGREFVTRKITYELAKIKASGKGCVSLGNMDSVRDWGYAPDYVKAMQLICESEKSDTYVVATNEITTVREFFKFAAEAMGFKPVFEGSGVDEKCVDENSGAIICNVNKEFFRPSDVNYLRGDYTKINNELGWKPTTAVQQMVEKMVKNDYQLVKSGIEL